MVKLARMFPLLALIGGVVLSVLPAEGLPTTIIKGTGTGINPSNTKNTAGVTVNGEHDSGENAFNPCHLQASVLAVVNNQVNLFGADVYPFNDGRLRVLNLRTSSSNTCVYDDGADFGPPPFPIFPRVILTLGRMGGTLFHFTLKYTQGKYVEGSFPPDPPNQDTPTCPAGLAFTPVQVALTTEFVLVDPIKPPIVVGGAAQGGTVMWCSLGPLGKPCDNLLFPPGSCQ